MSSEQQGKAAVGLMRKAHGLSLACGAGQDASDANGGLKSDARQPVLIQDTPTTLSMFTSRPTMLTIECIQRIDLVRRDNSLSVAFLL